MIFGGTALADVVDIVKQTRNSAGLPCKEIPKVIESKLGYKDLITKWLGNKLNGNYKVSLQVSAQKDIQADGVYVSYRWRPEWVWEVEDENVTPVNALARNWMAGKI